MSKQDTPTLEDMRKRLEILEEERAILHTLYRYGHSIDYGLEQEWIGQFTEDGIFDVRYREILKTPGHRHVGREALAQFIAGHTRAPAKYHKHLLMEPVITLKGKNEATVESYFVRMDETEGRPYIRLFGRYRDRLVKQEGRWLFRERIAEVEALHLPFSGARPIRS